MKKIRKIILIILILIIIVFCSIFGFIFSKGYSMYKVAIKEISIKDKFSEIQNQENFTEIDEVPKIFTEAIISVEDKRFYKHKGYDLISISRAVVTDFVTHDFTEGRKHNNSTNS